MWFNTRNEKRANANAVEYSDMKSESDQADKIFSSLKYITGLYEAT
jgi:hypothetical protein